MILQHFDHKTSHHPIDREGVIFHCTSCDTCHWTHATPHPEEAVQAATNHERDNR